VKAAESALTWPKSLYGKNLVIAGDETDRALTDFLCNSNNAKIKSFPVSHWGQSRLEFTPGISDSRVCHLDQYNASILNVFHTGVMGESVVCHRTEGLNCRPAPEPAFHTPVHQSNATPLLYNATTKGLRLHISPRDLAMYVWSQDVLEKLPAKRPIYVLTGSSLWDTKYFSEFLNSSSCGPSGDCEAEKSAFDQFDWQGRVTTYINGFRSGFAHDLQKVWWRTHPTNCPESNRLLQVLHGEQAKAAGNSIAAFGRRRSSQWSETKGSHPDVPRQELGYHESHHNPWTGIELLDWDAKCSEQKSCGCQGEHFQVDAYQTMLETMDAEQTQY
jgi:hypothetical protein